MIIDTQVHLWEANRPDRPWDPTRAPSLPEPFGPEQILPMMDEAGVDRVIIVPPGIMVSNNEFGLECAAKWPDRLAVTGLIDMVRPDIDEAMSVWLDQPGMIGIRTHVHPAMRERFGDFSNLDPFWRAAEKYGVPVTVFVPGALQLIADVPRRFPELKLVIDHLGLPQIDHGFEYPEFPDMLKLAEFENVRVKLSTLASRSLTGYPFVETHDMIKHAYEAYGPKRLFWGTDHTQQLARKRSIYFQEVDLIRKAVDFLTDEERRWILGENAAEYFGWPEGVKSTDLAKAGK